MPNTKPKGRGRSIKAFKNPDDNRWYMAVENHTVPAKLEYDSQEEKYETILERELPTFNVRVPGTIGEALSVVAMKKPEGKIYHPNFKAKAVRDFMARLILALGGLSSDTDEREKQIELLSEGISTESKGVLEISFKRILHMAQSKLRREAMDKKSQEAFNEVIPIDAESMEQERDQFERHVRAMAKLSGRELTSEELEAAWEGYKEETISENAEKIAEYAKKGTPVKKRGEKSTPKEEPKKDEDEDEDDGDEESEDLEDDGDDEDE